MVRLLLLLTYHIDVTMMKVAFELMGVIAVITNCSLVALSPSVKEYARGYSDVKYALFFVAAEVCEFSDMQRGAKVM